MASVSIFRALADLAIGAKAKRDKEHADFLAFYRELVETLPTEAVKLFGNLSGIKVVSGGAEQSFGIELSVTDYIWWKRHIENLGTRFVRPAAAIQVDMLEHLAKKTEAQKLAPEDRKRLLALLSAEPA